MSTSGNFLITGLPRSMTLWMSEFLTHGDCVCHHEPLIYMNTLADVKAFYDPLLGPANLGVSDSGAGWFLEEILSQIGPRTLIIERNIDDVQASLDGMGLNLPPTDYLDLLQARLNTVDNALVLRVRFEDLQQAAVMESCVAHLLPGKKFDFERYNTMIQSKITVNPKTVQGLLKHKGHLFDDVFKKVRLK